MYINEPGNKPTNPRTYRHITRYMLNCFLFCLLLHSIYYVRGHAHVAPISKWPWSCTSTGKMFPMIWSESARWLISYGVRKIQITFITPIGTPMWPRWANDHAVAQAKMVPMNLIWSESSQWLLSFGVRKVWPDERTDEGRRALHCQFFHRAGDIISWKLLI